MGSKNSCPIIITSKRCGTCQNLTWLSKFRGSWASVKQSPFHTSSYLHCFNTISVQTIKPTWAQILILCIIPILFEPNSLSDVVLCEYCAVGKKSWCSLERWINFIVTLYVTHSRLSEPQKLDIKLGKNLLKFKDKRQIFS